MKEFLPIEAPFSGGADDSSRCKSSGNLKDSYPPLLDKCGPSPDIMKM
jgi:hypothetical protein